MRAFEARFHHPKRWKADIIARLVFAEDYAKRIPKRLHASPEFMPWGIALDTESDPKLVRSDLLDLLSKMDLMFHTADDAARGAEEVFASIGYRQVLDWKRV